MTIMAQETLLFRWAGFSPALWLLIPAFSLDNTPRFLTDPLQCDINAPLPNDAKHRNYQLAVRRFPYIFHSPFTVNGKWIMVNAWLMVNGQLLIAVPCTAVAVSVVCFSPVTFSAQNLSISELLRTL